MEVARPINPTPLPGSFGEALRQHRMTARLTQEELAAGSGLSVRAIRDMECGRSARPYPRSVRLLAAALGLTAGQQAEFSDLLAKPPSVDGARVVSGVVPRQLPAAPELFVGRQAELSELRRLPTATAGTVVISAIGGTAGVGKTALAVYWAHRVAGEFPDGQLYVNLRGFGPLGTPAATGEVIRGFLDGLGVPAERIPHGLEAQAGLYRSLLASKQVLIVLDNAADEQQVRPLLPGSPGSLVLVTSRSQMAGLAALEGARLLSLDVLSPAEARDLLAARLGPARTAAESDAVGQIASLCSYLPLALAVAAARAAARPRLSLATLAAELRDAGRRLDALDAGDPAANVRAVFWWSYAQLSQDAARLFRLLALHPGPDTSVPAVASLAGVGESEARRLLAELTRTHLIAEPLPGRYVSHDLLRVYAAEQARAADDDTDRHEATHRVLDYYLHTAARAALLVLPSLEPVALAQPRPGVSPGQPADYRQALAWLEEEQQVLSASITLAAESGFDTHVWQLSWAIEAFLQIRGNFQKAAGILRTALTAARRLGDTAAQALCARLLAAACSRYGHDDQALDHFACSLTLYQRLGNRPGEARVHQGLGVLAERQGRYDDALGHAEQALRLYQAIGDKASEAAGLNNVGWIHGLLGDYQQARAFSRRALILSQEVSHLFVEGNAWDGLGYAEHHLGNFAEAVTCYQRALSPCREFGNRVVEANILTRLGDSYDAANDLPQAHDAWRQALAIFDDLQSPEADKVRTRLQGEAATSAGVAAAT